MKLALEVLSETFAAAAAFLWFISARVRLRKPGRAKRGSDTGLTIHDCFCVWYMSKANGAHGPQ